MLLFPLALLLGVLAGTAAGGSLRGLASLRLRAPAVPLIALVGQAALALPAATSMAEPARAALLGASYLAVGAWLVYNLRGRTTPLVTGIFFTAAGWLLNMCVVVANGGMPVSSSALGRIGAGAGALAGGGPLGKHVLLASTSVLGGLGDTIAVPAFGSVVSVGDVVMLAGLIVTVAAAMRLPRPAFRPATAD